MDKSLFIRNPRANDEIVINSFGEEKKMNLWVIDSI